MRRLSLSAALVFTLASAFDASSQSFQSHIMTAEQPRRYNCIDILELERLGFESTGNNTPYFNSLDTQLALDYFELIGWLEGYLTAFNVFGLEPSGNISHGTTRRDWMIWFYSYCRSNPTDQITNAVLRLLEALRSKN